MSLFNTNETYQILENPISQSGIKLTDSLDNANVDKIISIASTGISLKRDILSSVVETIISPLAVTDINTGNSISMANLTYLPIGLAALEPPPNATTLHISDTLLVDNPPGTNTITIDANTPSISLTNGTFAPSISVGGGIDPNALYINGNSANVEINSSNGNSIMGDITGVGNFTTLRINDSHFNIDLDCINLTANNDSYTYPICFTYRGSGNANYSTPSAFQDIFHQNINFPSFVMSPDTLPQYATWKIEFALNCFNMIDQSNKELAIYFELEDTNSAIYTPFLFNNGTPYTNHKNGSTYPGTPASENYTWSDYVDLNGVNGAVPLLFRLYWYAQSVNSFDFLLVVSFTKTNLLT